MGKWLEKLVDYAPVGLVVNALGGDAGGTASDIMDSLFQGDEHTIAGQSDYQKLTAKKLSDYIQKYMGLYEPGKEYSGLSSMMTPTTQESTGLDLLSNYLGKGDSETLGLASDVVNKTLKGDYDPYSSDYYGSMRRQLQEEKDKSMASAKRTAAKYGYRTSSSENKSLADVETKSGNKIADLIAQIQENERTRQLAAVPYGLQVSSAYDQSALNKIGASQQYGGLTRLLQNTGYQDFLRKQNELGGTVNTAQGLYSAPYTPDVSYEDPSLLSQLLGAAGQIAPYVMTMAASDRRLKNDIAWTGRIIKGLKLYTWKWKEWVSDKIKATPEIGFIAQEVQKLYPKAVKTIDGYLHIDYSAI